jgi:hypothetical protein
LRQAESVVGIEEGLHEPNSHMSWPLFINVSSAIYTPRNLMDCAKHVTQVGVGSVMCSLAKKANQAACKATFW